MGDVIKFPPKEESIEDRFSHVVKFTAEIELRTKHKLDEDLEEEVRAELEAIILGTAIVDIEKLGILSAAMTAAVDIVED